MQESNLHQLRVRCTESRGRPQLVFELFEGAPFGRRRAFPPLTLNAKAADLINEELRQLEMIERSEATSKDSAIRTIAAIGENLAKSLLPVDLQRALLQLTEREATLEIQSDDPAIPWELLKLSLRAEDGRWNEGPHLAEAFAIVRAFPEVTLPELLPLRRLAVVAPQVGTLPQSETEASLILDLFQERSRRVAGRKDDVLAELEKGSADGWHFLGHGSGRSPDPDFWPIELEDDERLPALEAGHAARRGFPGSRPLIFMSSCTLGKGGFALSGAGGWAFQMLEAGAGAFLGAQWKIFDQAGRIFAEAFYRSFLDGLSIAQAVRQARLVLRKERPDDPSWLAYAVYAHPLARNASRPAERAASCPPVTVVLASYAEAESPVEGIAFRFTADPLAESSEAGVLPGFPWERTFGDGLVGLRSKLATSPLTRSVRMIPRCTPATAIRAGAVFYRSSGFRVECDQQGALWDLEGVPEAAEDLRIVEFHHDPGARELNLLISVSRDVSDQWKEWYEREPRDPILALELQPGGGPSRESIRTAGHALGWSRRIFQIATQRTWRRPLLRIFLASPVGLALAIGRELNAVGEIIAMDLRKADGRYFEAFRFRA